MDGRKFVRLDGQPVACRLIDLDSPGLEGVLRLWRSEDMSHVPKRFRLCLGQGWHWGDVLQMRSGEVVAVQLEGGDVVGLVEYYFDEEVEEGLPAVGVRYLAQRPALFPRLGGIARLLLRHASQRSNEEASDGRVLIPEALGADRDDPYHDPRRLYEYLGFRTIGENGDGTYKMVLDSLGSQVLVAENPT